MTRSTIALAMLAYNEAKYIQGVIDSLGSRIDAYVICSDPPDNDGTIPLCESLFGELGIPGKVISRPWPATAADARNEVIDLARSYGTDYVMWIDPDSPLVGTIPDELSADIYGFRTVDNGTAWMIPHIIKSDCLDVRWEGRVHEYLKTGDHTVYVLANCYIYRNGSGGGVERMINSDLPLLAEDVDNEPNNPRWMFYLAQTHRDIGDKPNAQLLYRKRIAAGGWAEEVFWSMYMIADMDFNINWYLQAYNFRPSRVEPLHRLAALYNGQHLYNIAKMYAIMGLQHPPTEDIGFVEKWVIEYGLALELAVAEYMIGDKEQAKRLYMEILAHPYLNDIHRPIVEKNLRIAHMNDRKGYEQAQIQAHNG